MGRWHVSDGVLHVDFMAPTEEEAIAGAVEASEGELSSGSVEPSKLDPIIGLGSEAE